MATATRSSAAKGVRSNRDLIGIAEEILTECLNGATWKTCEIASVFDLTDQQVQKVKKYVKMDAASQGVLWGYYPAINAFRCCAPGAKTMAHEMLTYASEQWANYGLGLADMITGAEGMGFIDNRTAGRRRKSVEALSDKVAALGHIVSSDTK